MADAQDDKSRNQANERTQASTRPKVAPAQADAFWLTDLYPDAAALFQHEQASLQSIMADCIVVLDANVLLSPFELAPSSLEDISKVYAQLVKEKRLVVPGQAAREYYKHRSYKVARISDNLDGSMSKAKKGFIEKSIPLLSDDSDYKAVLEDHLKIARLGRELAEKLAAVRMKLKGEVGSDRVSRLYQSLLPECVVDIPCKTAEERYNIVIEADRRARLSIAPGFKDHSKEDGGLGDLIIWMTILQEGKARSAHCIFVTNEEKTDWWIKSQGIFQPRPDLIDEYRRATNGKSVHLLPLSGLLAAFDAASGTIKEVQRLEEDNRERIPLEAANILQNRIDEMVNINEKLNQFQNALTMVEAEFSELESEIGDRRGDDLKQDELIRLSQLRRIINEYKNSIAHLATQLAKQFSLNNNNSQSEIKELNDLIKNLTGSGF